MIRLPVAVLNHGNTVKFTEYSFLANVFAARGYEVVSIQHDPPTDPPMVTKIGEPYVGRLAQIERGVANIKFAVAQMRSGLGPTRTTTISPWSGIPWAATSRCISPSSILTKSRRW